MMRCHWCNKPVIATPLGYRHPGGGLYIQRCEKCNKLWDLQNSQFRCPDCGGDLLDDHCVMPVDDKARNA